MKSALKYAPLSLDDVIYPKPSVEARIKAYASGAMEGNLLLWGPNGTGKTTVANLLPVAMNGPDARIEASSFEQLVRKSDLDEYIARSCQWARLSGPGQKYFVVAHEMDTVKKGLSDFWLAMDKYADRLMVIITTNDAMAVHRSIRSRCDLVEFPAITAARMLHRARTILGEEGHAVHDSQILACLRQVEKLGDLRAYLSQIDQMLYLLNSGHQLPAATPATPALKVV